MDEWKRISNILLEKNHIKLPIEKQRILRKESPDIAAPLIHHYRDRLKPNLKEMNAKKKNASQ